MSRQVLLIEDNEQNLYLMRFLLRKGGYGVSVARSGPEGLELAVRIRPDLIVLDIQLPGMDGHAVARALRARPELARVPLVAVTSYAMAGDREEALAAGCDDYVTKPIDPDTFLMQVRSWLGAGT